MVPEWLTKIQNESGATENLPLFADDEEDVLVAGYTCIKTLFGADIAYRQIKEDLLARYEDMKQKYILDNRKFLPALWVSFFDGIGLTYEHNTRVFSVNGADLCRITIFRRWTAILSWRIKKKLHPTGLPNLSVVWMDFLFWSLLETRTR